MVETPTIGEIKPVQKVIFRNEGDSWCVEGYALILKKIDGTFKRIPIEIRGRQFDEIPNGAQIIGIDYAPKVTIAGGDYRSSSPTSINHGSEAP